MIWVRNIDSLVFPSLHFALIGSFLTLVFQKYKFPKAILVVESSVTKVYKFISIRKELFPVGSSL